jgi:hypothetical protein
LFNHIVLFDLGQENRPFPQYETELILNDDLANLPSSKDRSISGEVHTAAYSKYLKVFETNSTGTKYEGSQRDLKPDAYNEIIQKDDSTD